MRKDGLTEQEGIVMDKLIDAWNEFLKLEVTHPSELTDFNNGIHLLQQILCMRVMRRDYPLGYPTYKNNKLPLDNPICNEPIIIKESII